MTDLLTLNTSNRLESLVDRLAESLREAAAGPFERDLVVVQSQGMRRYLMLELTKRWGVVGSLEMPFPRDLIRQLAKVFAKDEAVRRPFDRSMLSWRIFAALGRLDEGSVLDPLRHFLAGDTDQRKRFQLASRLASLFDDYLLYRPDVVLGWEASPPGADASPDERWQAWLFRQAAALPDLEAHLARQLASLKSHLQEARPAAGLPRRVSVFGVSSLPPSFVELLGWLARWLPVDLYFVSPTWHFWGDLRSDREAALAARRRRLRAPDLAEGHFERGNALLTALGRQGREFFNLLLELDHDGQAWREIDFSDPGQGSTLAILQSDIYHVIDRSQTAPPLPLPDDRSLTVHICHSPWREMEVLRDQLLLAFDQLPGLQPSDILVLATEIERYGPAIEAVFGISEPGQPRWPFAVADRSGEAIPPASTFLNLLSLATGRFTQSDVFDLLDISFCRRAANVEETELPMLRRLAESTRISWGIDAEQRSLDFDLPAFGEGSWRQGLDRLLLGYALGPTDGEASPLVAGLLPAAGDTVQDADLIGRFAGWLDLLFGKVRALRRPRSLEAWADALTATLGEFFAAEAGAEEDELQSLREAIAELRRQASEAAGDVTLEAMRQHLKEELAGSGRTSGPPGGFLTGGLTFCALQPMRNVPHRVIAIVGLGDAAFPRRRVARPFDLLAASPRPGDRSPALDDRYLFLETLLATRDRLILSYIGQSQHDLSELAPSVVLAELLDQIDRTFSTADGRAARHALIERHPLQSFSPSYFVAESTLSSASQRDFEACVALLQPKQELGPFFPMAATGKSADERMIALDDLLDFLRDPSEFFCRRILGIFLERDLDEAAETEPFTLDALGSYQVLRALVEARLAASDRSADVEPARFLAAGELPVAGLGQAHFKQLRERAEDFLKRLPPIERQEPIEIALELESARLEGIVRDLTTTGVLRYHVAGLRPSDRLLGYAVHAAVNAWQLDRGQRPGRTLLVGVDRTFELRPIARPHARLEVLVEAYRCGRRSPLPLFEQASSAWAEQEWKLADPRQRARLDASEAARRAFAGGWNKAGDAERRSIELLWRGRDPLGDEFRAWSRKIWWPILEISREVDG